jgi:hypothetical protein
MFIIIVIIIFALQILLINVTGLAFGIYPYFGLTIQQWGISVFFNLF